MSLCRTSHSPLYAFATAVAVGSMLTACGGNGSDGDTTTTEIPSTSETSVTHTETTIIETPVSPAPTSPPAEMPGTPPGDDNGDATIEIPSPGIPSPPPIPAPPAIPSPPPIPMP